MAETWAPTRWHVSLYYLFGVLPNVFGMILRYSDLPPRRAACRVLIPHQHPFFIWFNLGNGIRIWWPSFNGSAWFKRRRIATKLSDQSLRISARITTTRKRSVRQLDRKFNISYLGNFLKLLPLILPVLLLKLNLNAFLHQFPRNEITLSLSFSEGDTLRRKKSCHLQQIFVNNTNSRLIHCFLNSSPSAWSHLFPTESGVDAFQYIINEGFRT